MTRIGKLKLRDNRWYGRRADVPDQRDFIFHLEFPHLVASVEPLPLSVDLRTPHTVAPCYDQGQLGSCVGNSCAFAYDYEQRKQGEKGYTPSRLFVYYNARAIEGTIKSDAGCEIRDGIKAVAKLGAPPETLWHYTITKFATKPSVSAYAAGKKRRALKYARVENRGTSEYIRAALAGGLPVIIGMSVYASFESQGVTQSGVVPMPAASEEMLGGHSMALVGYKADAAGGIEFITRNSWGKSWGDGGYCYLPEAYLIDANLASDFWVVSSVQ